MSFWNQPEHNKCGSFHLCHSLEGKVCPFPRHTDKRLFNWAERTGTWGARAGELPEDEQPWLRGRHLARLESPRSGRLGSESWLETVNVPSPDDFMECPEPSPHAALQPAGGTERGIKGEEGGKSWSESVWCSQLDWHRQQLWTQHSGTISQVQGDCKLLLWF